MKKVVLACLTAGLFSSLTASAATVKFHDGPGTTGGGEFYADLGADNVGPLTASNGAKADYISFCLEKSETLAFNTVYHYEVAQKTTSNDFISRATAWLYLQFLSGTLAGYNGTSTAANNLQNAIWFLEDEGGQNNAYAQLAMANAAHDIGTDAKTQANNGYYGVGVMQLWSNPNRTGARQDQLIRINVPDGGTTLVFLGMAMTGLAAASRRSRKN